MIRYLYVITIFVFSIVTSCTFFGIEKEEPEVNGFIPLWEYDFNIGYFSSLDPIIHDNKVIYTSLDEKRNDLMANNTLEAFNKENGEMIWRWDETVDKPGDQFYFKGRHHIYNNILYISSGADYAINLDNGTTDHYLNETKYGGQAFFGKENKIYTALSNIDSELQLERSDIVVSGTESFDWKLFLKGLTTDSTVIGFNQVIFDKLEPNLLFIPYTEAYWGVEKVFTGLMVFNLLKYEVILDKKITEIGDKYPVEQLSIIHDDRIFIPTRGKTICLDKNTGELLWQTEVNGRASLSGILFPENNQLYVNTEFGVYCLDPETGAFKWKKEFGEKEGNSSRMQYHNDVIYYIGGGRFHARDANTGEQLLFFEAPSSAKDDGAFFQPVMTFDHENDRIYTASYTHAYCYPTLR